MFNIFRKKNFIKVDGYYYNLKHITGIRFITDIEITGKKDSCKVIVNFTSGKFAKSYIDFNEAIKLEQFFIKRTKAFF